jgi:hypothetical protein
LVHVGASAGAAVDGDDTDPLGATRRQSAVGAAIGAGNGAGGDATDVLGGADSGGAGATVVMGVACDLCRLAVLGAVADDAGAGDAGADGAVAGADGAVAGADDAVDGSRTSRPHDTQVDDQPVTIVPHARQRPGGASQTRTDAIGPRIAPKAVHWVADRRL